MASYKVTFKKSISKDLRDISNKDVKCILKRIHELSNNPRAVGCVKLSNQERYRVRQGIYRIIYEIRDSELVITIVKVAHRSTVYKIS